MTARTKVDSLILKSFITGKYDIIFILQIMRLGLSLYIFLLAVVLGSCGGESTQEVKPEVSDPADDSTEFERMLNMLPEMQLPVTVDGCQIMRNDSRNVWIPNKDEFPSYYMESGAYLGKVSQDNFTIVISLGGADCYLPIVTTYDSLGNKISSGGAYMGYCGDGPCYECFERFTLNEALNISVVDSSFAYDCDEKTYKKLNSVPQVYTSWMKGHISKEGIVSLGKMKGDNARTEFGRYLRSLDTIPPHIRVSSLEDFPVFSEDYGKEAYKQYKHSWCVAPVGILDRYDSSVVIIEYSVGDISRVPFVISYNLEGEKIDSLSLYQCSGFDAGYKGFEWLEVKAPYFEVADTTYLWDYENSSESEADTIVGMSIYTYHPSGIFVNVLKEKEVKLKNTGGGIEPKKRLYKNESSSLTIIKRGEKLLFVDLDIAHQHCAMPNYKGFLYHRGKDTFTGLVMDFNGVEEPLTIHLNDSIAVVTSSRSKEQWHLGMNCWVEGKYRRFEK